MSTLEVDNFLEHYGVKGMKWGVRNDRSTSRSERKVSKSLQKTERKGNKTADRYTAKARRNEKNVVRSREGIAERQKVLDRIATGKLQSTDILELVGTANVITAAGMIVNRQSYRKQYALDQQSVVDGATKGVAIREQRAKEQRKTASAARRGANEATRQLTELGWVKLP